MEAGAAEDDEDNESLSSHKSTILEVSHNFWTAHGLVMSSIMKQTSIKLKPIDGTFSPSTSEKENTPKMKEKKRRPPKKKSRSSRWNKLMLPKSMAASKESFKTKAHS